MKKLLGFLWLVAVCHSPAKIIETKALTPDDPIPIAISDQCDTTVQFPDTINGVYGLDIAQEKEGEQTPPCRVAYKHPDPSGLIDIHAVTPDARAIMKVVTEGKIYVLLLQASTDPEAAVTLTKGLATQSVSGGIVTPAEVKAQRPRMDDQFYVGLLERARIAPLAQASAPNLYEGYSTRPARYSGGAGTGVETTVTQVSRFSKDDAIVIKGTLTNKTDRPVNFDGRAVTVIAGNQVHPAKMVSCQRPVASGASVPIEVIIQGSLDGVSRANLSLSNEFRIETPIPDGQPTTLWDVKNGGAPKGPFKITKPVEQTIPRAQTTTIRETQ